MSEFNEVRKPIARKRHVCDVCFRSIPAGQRYVRNAGKWDGEFYSVAMHDACAEIFDVACSEHVAPPWEGTAFGEALEICRGSGLVEDVDGRWRLKKARTA